MSTNETNTANVEAVTESLDDFAEELFGGSNSAPDNAKSNKPDEDEDTPDNAPEEQDEVDTLDSDDLDYEEVSEDDDTLAPETDDDEEDSDEDNGEDEESDLKPKKKKNRFQERIDELTASRKDAERKAEDAEREAEALRQAYEKRISELEGKLKGDSENETPEPKTNSETTGPNPDALNKDGSKKYPLGEYDPKYLKDTVQHMLDEKEREQKEQQQLSEQQQKQQQAQTELQQEWNSKLDTARERYPDFQSKGEQMLTVFEGIDQAYGEYLTTAIMELDNGPDVFYYLSNNIDEAQEIVNAGAKKATIRLGALDAKLGDGGRKGKSGSMRTSRAKSPPPQNKGSSVAKPRVPVDTDDLNAFERELFKSKR